MTLPLVILPFTTQGEIIRKVAKSNAPLLVNEPPLSIVKGVELKSSSSVNVIPGSIIIEPPLWIVVSSIVTSAVAVTVCRFRMVITPEAEVGMFSVTLKPPPVSSSQVLGSFQLPDCLVLKGF